ncbi:hypothetical protein [Cupriavidus sp. HPC(L)]|uniref:hypothetical protein n=1 Tax=Cupriavidus sp. HPC(L) TaxID=1217418 RepID=UPI0012EEC584|nr:hypothetical protein [Cupriavidus sp. HPC(L)]
MSTTIMSVRIQFGEQSAGLRRCRLAPQLGTVLQELAAVFKRGVLKLLKRSPLATHHKGNGQLTRVVGARSPVPDEFHCDPNEVIAQRARGGLFNGEPANPPGVSERFGIFVVRSRHRGSISVDGRPLSHAGRRCLA